MYIVNMETEHYSWYALGRTEKDAKEAILDKWNERADKMTRIGRPIKICRNIDDLTDMYDMRVIQVQPGECIYY